MKIDSIHLENYCCFENVYVEFDDKLTVLVGGNGSGKTVLLNAVMNKVKKLYEKTRDSSLIPFPVIVYYTADRNMKTRAQMGMDFPASSEWFITKATQISSTARDLNDFEVVCRAITEVLADSGEEYEKPWVHKTPPRLYITRKNKPDERLEMDDLGAGRSLILSLVLDLARRMVVANEHAQWPEGQSVLHSPGIVLIDEIEWHLHPSWQQAVLPKLMEIFPKVQFIVTTHSPQVLTTVAVKHIRVLKDGQSYTINDETEGAEPSRLLKDVLGVDSLRPKQNKWVQKLNEYRELVYKEQWDDPHAIGLRQELGKHFTDADPELMQLDLHVENSTWERGL